MPDRTQDSRGSRLIEMVAEGDLRLIDVTIHGLTFEHTAESSKNHVRRRVLIETVQGALVVGMAIAATWIITSIVTSMF